MIGLTITFPQMVMHYKGPVVDPGEIEIRLPEQPGFGLPPLGGAPAAGRTAPRIRPSRRRPANDLSKPPSFN